VVVVGQPAAEVHAAVLHGALKELVTAVVVVVAVALVVVILGNRQWTDTRAPVKQESNAPHQNGLRG
jgi:hypothetical protein